MTLCRTDSHLAERHLIPKPFSANANEMSNYFFFIYLIFFVFCCFSLENVDVLWFYLEEIKKTKEKESIERKKREELITNHES